ARQDTPPMGASVGGGWAFLGKTVNALAERLFLEENAMCIARRGGKKGALISTLVPKVTSADPSSSSSPHRQELRPNRPFLPGTAARTPARPCSSKLRSPSRSLAGDRTSGPCPWGRTICPYESGRACRSASKR